jgi:DNA polymerase-3 subunit beta
MMHDTIEAAPAATETPLALYIERDRLHDALQLLGRVVERRNTIPILSHLLFEMLADGSGVAITATDLDTQLTLTLPYNRAPEGSGRFCVVAETLAGMVKKAEKGGHLEFRIADGRAEMISGRTRGKLTIAPADDFPVLSAEGEAVAFALPAEQFAGDLARVAWAIGKEEVRYYLMGTALQLRDGNLFTVACNGGNIAWTERAAPAEAEGLADSIIPRKACDIIRRTLKGREGALGLTIAARENAAPRLIAEIDGVRLVSKTIEGTPFPDWQPLRDGMGERQIVPFPETEPRMPLPAVEMCTKALGSAPVVEMAEEMILMTSPDAPEFGAIAMLLKADTLPAGYAYELAKGWADGGDKALEYLTGLATDAGLPQFSHESECFAGYAEEEEARPQFQPLYGRRGRRHRNRGTAPPRQPIMRKETVVDSHVVVRAGMVMGATFGRQGYQTFEEPDYETFTIRTVEKYVGGDVYQEGSYSVAMPRERRGMAAAVTVGTPGVDERAVATKGGCEIALTEAQVRAMAGDPAEFPRVEIKPYPMHHGRRLPDGFAPPRKLTTVAPDAKDHTKARSMTDREITRAYCADPAGTIARLQPQPTTEAELAVESIVAFAKALSGWHGDAVADKPSAAIIPFPAELRAAQIAAETPVERLLEAPKYRDGLPAAWIERRGDETWYGFPAVGRMNGAGWIVPDRYTGDEAIRYALGSLKTGADGEDRPQFLTWARIVSAWTRDALAALPPSAETDAPAEAAETPQDAREEKPAELQGSEPEIAPEAALAAPEVPMEAVGEIIGVMIAELQARVAALEAAANDARTQPEADSGAEPAAHLSRDNNFSRERRLRIVRRYLSLRRQRDGAREQIANLVESIDVANRQTTAAERRAEDAEFRAADLDKRVEELSAELAAETARADSADGRWQIVLDEKQARIVALENEKIERLSGGRIKLSGPFRANAQPVWPASIHGRA